MTIPIKQIILEITALKSRQMALKAGIIPDYTLSKFACKLVCMNGDPVQKPIVAMAQAYFAIAINNYEDIFSWVI